METSNSNVFVSCEMKDQQLCATKFDSLREQYDMFQFITYANSVQSKGIQNYVQFNIFKSFHFFSVMEAIAVNKVLAGIDVREIDQYLSIKCLFTNEISNSVPVCINIASNINAQHYTKSNTTRINTFFGPLLLINMDSNHTFMLNCGIILLLESNNISFERLFEFIKLTTWFSLKITSCTSSG